MTFDALEGGVTAAVLDICDSAAECGFTDSPLAIVCRSIVAHLPDVKFAACVTEADDVWQVPAIQPNQPFEHPSRAVARKFTAFLRKRLGEDDTVALASNETRPYVPESKRRRWRQTTCLAFAVKIRGRRVALIALFCPDEMEITLRERSWLAVFSRLASAFCSRHEQMCQMRRRYETAEGALRTGVMALESARRCVTSHRASSSTVDGSLKLADEALYAALARAEGKLGMSDILLKRDADGRLALRSDELSAWVDRWVDSPRIKAIVGLRGTNKPNILRAIREWIVHTRGVPEGAVVFIDCEDAHFRQYRTVEDVLEFLDEIHSDGGDCFLFLNEVAMIPWHEELLRRLSALGRWNVWVASSAHRALCDASGKLLPEIEVRRQWADPDIPRTQVTLERIWSQIFMRDAVSASEHVDVRALEAVAAHTSDHLGETPSLRQVVTDLKAVGVSLSPNTVRSYLSALKAAYLIEAVPAYDVFERQEIGGVSVRVFWTDLELRNWRFGPAREHDGIRLALNRLYLDLRRKYGKVYTPRGADADFLTLEPDGTPRCWSLPQEGYAVPPLLRGGVVRESKRQMSSW